MIYVGYPCIGKSSVAGQDRFIDLESSLFNDGSENGAEKYVSVAKDLSDQRYDVFLSSHRDVRDLLRDNYPFICVFPCLKLENEGFTRVAERYHRNPSEKNLRALERVARHYKDDITDLLKERAIIVIKSLDFGLKNIVKDPSNLSPITFKNESMPLGIDFVNKKTASDLWDLESTGTVN